MQPRTEDDVSISSLIDIYKGFETGGNFGSSDGSSFGLGDCSSASSNAMPSCSADSKSYTLKNTSRSKLSISLEVWLGCDDPAGSETSCESDDEVVENPVYDDTLTFHDAPDDMMSST